MSRTFKNIFKNYNIDLLSDILFKRASKNQNFWTSTSNHIISGSNLKKFVKWFNVLIDDIKDLKTGAHVHERALVVYNEINGLNTLFLDNIITHEQLKSHGIEAAV